MSGSGLPILVYKPSKKMLSVDGPAARATSLTMSLIPASGSSRLGDRMPSPSVNRSRLERVQTTFVPMDALPRNKFWLGSTGKLFSVDRLLHRRISGHHGAVPNGTVLVARRRGKGGPGAFTGELRDGKADARNDTRKPVSNKLEANTGVVCIGVATTARGVQISGAENQIGSLTIVFRITDPIPI